MKTADLIALTRTPGECFACFAQRGTEKKKMSKVLLRRLLPLYANVEVFRSQDPETGVSKTTFILK